MILRPMPVKETLVMIIEQPLKPILGLDVIKAGCGRNVRHIYLRRFARENRMILEHVVLRMMR